MIALINQVLQMGYTASEVLNFIGKKIPSLGSNITQAKTRGYGDNDILKFLQGKIKVNHKAAERQKSAMEEYMGATGHKNKEERQNDKARFLSGALGLAGTAYGAYNLGKKLQGHLPGLSQRGQGGPQIGPQPGGTPTPPPPNAPMPNQSNAPISPNQPKVGPQNPKNGPQSGVSQPKMPKLTPYQQQQSQMPHDPKQILDDMGLTQSIENLQQAGNEPEAIKAAIEHQVKPFQRDWLRKQTGLDIGAVVDQYLQNPSPNQNIEGQQQPNEAQQNQEQNNAQNNLQEIGATTQEIPPKEQIAQTPQTQAQSIEKPSFKETKPIAKGSTVITPEGDFAKVEDLPGKTAKIDVEGKKRVIEADELTSIPDNEEELLDIYERLINKIPEHLRSSVANWVGYNDEKNLLQIKFHSGDAYTFKNIPPEFVRKLEAVEHVAKTTGGNIYAVWEEGEASRGAGISQLIQELQKQYGGKGKEYEVKFRQVYSFFGLPEQLLKEKQQREREASKEKKKNEREEKKKRKGTS